MPIARQKKFCYNAGLSLLPGIKGPFYDGFCSVGFLQNGDLRDCEIGRGYPNAFETGPHFATSRKMGSQENREL